MWAGTSGRLSGMRFFALASILLAIFYGAALGNVVRGVPLDAAGNFFEPLWTDFLPRGQTGILDWYTVLVGVAALAALALHGAAWLAYKTEGELNERALRCARTLWWPVALATVAITIASFRLEPWLLWGFRGAPVGIHLPHARHCGAAGHRVVRAREAGRRGLRGFLRVLDWNAHERDLQPLPQRAALEPQSLHLGLTVANARAGDYGLEIGLIWWVIGMTLAAGYTIFAYRSFAGKIGAGDAETDEGY